MTIDEWKNYWTAMRKGIEDYMNRSDDYIVPGRANGKTRFMKYYEEHPRSENYLDAATYMLNMFGIRPYSESAINPLGKVINTKETENGITFDIQSIKEKENKPMRQCDIDFEKKKVDLKKEMDQALFDLQTKWEEDKIQIRSEYNQKLLDLEKENHEAEIKEQTDEQAKALKALYDSYVAAGFTKTDAKEFVTLELKSDD